MTRPLIIIGNGGHAQVLADLLQRQNREIIGYTSPSVENGGIDDNGLKRIGDDDANLSFPPDAVHLVNGIGSVGDGDTRNNIFKMFQAKNYEFATAVHDAAIVAQNVTLGEGVQVMAGVIVQPGSNLGDNSILNTACSVDHHCLIGNNCHVAPGATLSGSVKLGEDVHVGAGATIIQNIEIGAGSLIGAGSVVTENLPANSKVTGVPARPMSV